MSSLDSFPEELLKEIADSMDISTLEKFSRTNSKMQRIGQESKDKRDLFDLFVEELKKDGIFSLQGPIAKKCMRIARLCEFVGSNQHRKVTTEMLKLALEYSELEF